VQWEEFAVDSQARVLRWLIQADELRMIEAFLATEEHDEGGQLPVLFVRCDRPFASGWGLEVRATLIELHDEALAQGSLSQAEAWTPEPIRGDDRHEALTALAGVLAALNRGAGQTLAELITLVATPKTVAEPELWNAWLADFARRAPAEVRCLIIDHVDAPQLEPLAKHGGPAIMTREPALDIAGATSALAAGRDPGKPEDLFRQLFVGLGEAAKAGDLGQVRGLGRKALALTRTQQWPQLEVVVRMVLANSLLAAGLIHEAVAEFQAADTTAQQAGEAEQIERGDADRLRLTALLGLGSALVSAGDHHRAAQVYGSATTLAVALEDHATQIDCWRMVAHCHEQTGDLDGAWRAGLYAIGAGEALPADRRPHSTLAWAGDRMLRIAEANYQYRSLGAQVDAKLSELFGRRDWRAQVSG